MIRRTEKRSAAALRTQTRSPASPQSSPPAPLPAQPLQPQRSRRVQIGHTDHAASGTTGLYGSPPPVPLPTQSHRLQRGGDDPLLLGARPAPSPLNRRDHLDPAGPHVTIPGISHIFFAAQPHLGKAVLSGRVARSPLSGLPRPGLLHARRANAPGDSAVRARGWGTGVGRTGSLK